MTESPRVDRRTVLARSAGIAVAAALAGCTEPAAVHGEWRTVETIVLEARPEGWIGVEPGPIEGETNPTLVLQQGRRYEIVAESGDGEVHSLEFRNADESVVEDARTERIEGGGRASLSVWAGRPIAEYVCGVHPETLRGEIDLQPERDTDTVEEPE